MCKIGMADSTFQEQVETLTWDHIELGRQLGSGSFNTVFDFEWNPKHMKAKCRGGNQKTDEVEEPLPLVIKCLSDATFTKGNAVTNKLASDLQFEARLLISLPKHKHIVRFFGASQDTFDPNGAPEDSFLVLEKLKETTMESTLQRLRNRRLIDTPLLASVVDLPIPSSRKRKETEDSRQRTRELALPVARALNFLHCHQVMYRDLKPENIGFDQNDNVRLFDFGLSRHIPHDMIAGERASADASYWKKLGLTRCVGTPRYMAPEVQKGSMYDFSCDVYSFGLLLAEIYSLERPQGNRSVRRSCCKIGCRKVKALVRTCLEKDRCCRPSMALVEATMEQFK